MKENKTAKALELMRQDPTLTVYGAAKACGISPTTLYAGKRRAEASEGLATCPCCGSKVDRSKIQLIDEIEKVATVSNLTTAKTLEFFIREGVRK